MQHTASYFGEVDVAVAVNGDACRFAQPAPQRALDSGLKDDLWPHSRSLKAAGGNCVSRTILQYNRAQAGSCKPGSEGHVHGAGLAGGISSIRRASIRTGIGKVQPWRALRQHSGRAYCSRRPKSNDNWENRACGSNIHRSEVSGNGLGRRDAPCAA